MHDLRLAGSQIARSLLYCSISLSFANYSVSFANCSVSFVLLGFGLFCMVLSLVHRDRAQESKKCQRDELLHLFCNCLVSFVVSCTLSSNCTAFAGLFCTAFAELFCTAFAGLFCTAFAGLFCTRDHSIKQLHCSVSCAKEPCKSRATLHRRPAKVVPVGKALYVFKAV